MKKFILPAVIVVGLVAVVAGSVFQSFDSEKGTKVYSELAEERDISNIVKASGQIDPRIKVNVSSHVVAKIETLYVVEGQEVEKGQPFLELEKETLRAVRQQAAAQLKISKSQFRGAKIDREDAQQKLKRAERLSDGGISSAEFLEGATLREKSAILQVDQAAQTVQQALASLQKADDDLRKATIYSPLSGRVISLSAEEGEVVVSGTMNNSASVIGIVADLSEVLAEVDVDETEIVDVELGQPAIIVVDAVSDLEIHGTVVEIASSGFSRLQQPDVTFFKVKVLLTEPDGRLRPGMSARAEIEVATELDTLVVPIQAVVYREPVDAEDTSGGTEKEKVVFVVEEGQAVQRSVVIGITDTTHAEILEGLETGDEVVIGPSRTLKKLQHDEVLRVEDPEVDSEKDSEEDDDE